MFKLSWRGASPSEVPQVSETSNDTDATEKLEYETPLREPRQESELQWYTSAEVAQHRTGESAWVIYEREVYDITGYAAQHPGGARLIIERLGTDISSPFESFFHGKHARDLLRSMRIGRLKDAPARQLLAPPGGSKGALSLPQKGPASSRSGLVGAGRAIGLSATVVSGSPKQHDVTQRIQILSTPTVSSQISLHVSPPNKPGFEGSSSQRSPPGGERGFPGGVQTFRIVDKTALVGDAWLLQLQGHVSFSLFPGQHVMISADVRNNGKVCSRPYTPIACSGRGLQLLVRSYEGGEMSPYLCSAGNAEVQVSGPLGSDLRDHIEPNGRKPLVLFAAGTGIAAFMLLVQRAALEKQSLVLVWSERHPAREIMRLLAAAQCAVKPAKICIGVLSDDLQQCQHMRGLELEPKLSGHGRLSADIAGEATRVAGSIATNPLPDAAEGNTRVRGDSHGTALVCGPPNYNAAVAVMLRSASYQGTVKLLE